MGNQQHQDAPRMPADIPITLLEAFSRGEITRKDIEDQTGEAVSFAALLAQLHRHHLPLPRLRSHPREKQRAGALSV
jgi:hypothetical protein